MSISQYENASLTEQHPDLSSEWNTPLCDLEDVIHG